MNGHLQEFMEYVLTTDKLTKKYGRVSAAKDIDIRIRRGEIYGLIGRNGAGKTTIMRMLSGLSTPTSGSYTLFGKVGKDVRGELHKVGVLIEAPGIYPHMNAYDNLKVKCLGLGVYTPQYVKDLLELVGLSDTGKKKAGAFSLGMRQRLGIALALAGEPELIILDEPINGLDPQGIVEVRNILARLRDERKITIMISSHILEELGKLADSYAIINDGLLVDQFTKDDLQIKSGNNTHIVTDDNEKALKLINASGIAEGKMDSDGRIIIEGALDRDRDVVKFLVGKDIFVKEVVNEEFSLEDYFLRVTGGGQANG